LQQSVSATKMMLGVRGERARVRFAVGVDVHLISITNS
jgi:hypothetical protein